MQDFKEVPPKEPLSKIMLILLAASQLAVTVNAIINIWVAFRPPRTTDFGACICDVEVSEEGNTELNEADLCNADPTVYCEFEIDNASL